MEAHEPLEIEWLTSAADGSEPLIASLGASVEAVSTPRYHPARDAIGEWIEHRALQARRWRRVIAEWSSMPNPRRTSRVRRHVWRPADELLHDLVDRQGLDVQVGRHRLRCPATVPEYSPIDGLHRVPGTLHVSMTLSELPVWLTVERWWNGHCMVGLALRRTGRWRYSRRYFTAAHESLARLDRQLQVGIVAPSC